MGKVTSKYQVTVPKVIAERYGIKPGDELRWEPAGGVIRVAPAGSTTQLQLSVAERLALFDAATERQLARQQHAPAPSPSQATDRGWTREELYEERISWPR